MILLERAPAAVRNQTNDGGFSAYVLPLGNVEKNNGRAPWGDAAQFPAGIVVCRCWKRTGDGNMPKARLQQRRSGCVLTIILAGRLSDLGHVADMLLD